MTPRLLSSVAGSALLLAATACQHASDAQTDRVKRPPNEVWITQRQVSEGGIATSVATDRPVGNALTTTGRVAFSDIEVGHVFSPVTGRVTKIFVTVGQSISLGAPLAALQSPDLSSAVSDLEKADADLSAAQRDYERQKELYDAHAAAQRDFEAAQSTYLKARAERNRAAEKSKLLLASTQSSATQEYVLRAPIAGEVFARNVTLGMEIQGQYSGGTTPELFTIGNLAPLWVFADVFEIDLPRILLGAPVTVNVVSYPGHPFQSRVDWISGTLDPTTRTAKVRCTIDNAQHLLRPEMFASISIETETRDTLAIPRSAVVRLGDSMVAFVDRGPAPTGGERFERRIIGIDERESGDYAPVTLGLRTGEKVVSSGAIILSGVER
jgi:cobalt-zinc-cadmium efflux system membrane fusion protein